MVPLEEKRSGHKGVKIGLFILGVLMLFFVMVWARAFYGSMEAYKEGERLLASGQYVRAVTYFDRAMHWYAPLNPYVTKSAEMLWEIGTKAQERGDRRLALIAFRTIPTAFYGARHVLTPGKEWIKKSRARIRTLVDQEKEEGRNRQGLPPPSKKKAPGVIWSMAVVIGFLGWAGSAVGLIIFGIGKKGGRSPFWNAIPPWTALIIGFFALWIAGMMTA